jgi:predicted ester cyclase
MFNPSDYTLGDAKRAEITRHLNPTQKKRAFHWMDLQAHLNKGDFVGMDAFFDPEMTYGNPSRPDLGTYEQWKTSPVALYKTFPPCLYRTLAVTARGDDEIWVYCDQVGKQTGGNYMGVPPKGQELHVEWFSIVTFRNDKILRIFSIADVLGMFIQVGVIDPKMIPTDPYK